MLRTLLVTSLVSLLTLAVVGCGGGGAPDPEELVPQGTNLILQVQVDELLLDADVAVLYEALPRDEEDDRPATLQGLLDLGEMESGLDFRAFTSVLLFGNISYSGQEFGLIAQGTFQEQDFLGAVERATGKEFTSTEYRGHQVYRFEDDQDAGELVFLDDEMLLFGSEGTARRVIDIWEGDDDPASGHLIDTFQSLKSPILKLAFQPTAEVLRSVEFIPIPTGFSVNLSSLKELRVVAITVDKKEADFTAQASLEFASEESASSFGDTVDGAVKLGRGLLTDETAVELLNKVEVTLEGVTVTVDFQITVEELTDIIQKQGFDVPGLFGGTTKQSTAILGEAPRKVAPILEPRPQLLLPIQDPIHVEPGQPHEPYNSSPPTSGPHYSSAAPWGISSEPIPDELQVHNLEHGGVFIQYSPQDDPEIRRLVEVLVPRFPDYPCFIIVAPYPMDHTIALTAWGVVQYMDSQDGINVAAILDFVNTYRGQGPERVPCSP